MTASISIEFDRVEDRWAGRVLKMLTDDPRYAAAWKFWHASNPVNLGHALRFRVSGSKHSGYITIIYAGGPDEKYKCLGCFDVEFAVVDELDYKIIKKIGGVFRDDLVKTISTNVI